jgi:hypothetical protein
MANPDDTARQQATRRALRAAMQQPDRYLAALLAEETDETLAAAVGGRPDLIWKLRLVMYPRPAYWDHDVHELAAAIHGDPELLDGYLRGLGLGPQAQP